MKKTFAILLAVLLCLSVFGLVACNLTNTDNVKITWNVDENAVVAISDFDKLPTEISAKTELTLEITAKEGYEIDSVTLNGEAVTPKDGKYVVTLTAASTIAVTVKAEDPSANCPVTWDVDEHATVTVDNYNSLPAKVAEGTTLTFAATAAEGYAIGAVTFNGEAIEAENGKYSVTIDGEATIAVSTRPADSYGLTWKIDEHATVTVNGYDSLPTYVARNTQMLQFTVTADEDYEVLSVTSNGYDVQNRGGNYSLRLQGDAEIVIVCGYVDEFEITKATLAIYNDMPCFVLQGTCGDSYTKEDLEEAYFDIQNYMRYNGEYDWNTWTAGNGITVTAEINNGEFAIYVNLADLPGNIVAIPHFGAPGGSGDIRDYYAENGKSITHGTKRYTMDTSATEYSCSTFTITDSSTPVTPNIPNIGNRILSDDTVPEQNEIKLYEYYTPDTLPRIDINTEDGIALDDKKYELGRNKGTNHDVMEYTYANATISVSNSGDSKYELTDIAGKVKIRGNYTSTYPKKPLRIKFDKKQVMLGLNGGEKIKSWVLLSEWKDSSMLRNSTAAYIGNALLESDGFYCTDFRYVEVYINGQYNGLYLLAEQQQVNKNRVNIPEVADETDTNVKIGYMIEYDGYYGNEAALEQFTINYNTIKNARGSNVNPYQRGFSISSDVNTQEQHDFIQKCVQTIWNVVYDATYNQHGNLATQPYHTMDENGNYVVDETIKTPREAIEKVIDIQSLVDMYILQEICVDMDLSWSSFFFSLDMSETGNHLLTYTAPWDFDSALGMAANFANTDGLNAMNAGNPWLTVFANQNWFWKMVEAKWNKAVEAGVFSGVLEMIDTYTEKYVEIYKKNFDRWPDSIGRQIESQQVRDVANFKTQAQAAAYLKSWLTERISNLTRLFAAQAAMYTVQTAE